MTEHGVERRRKRDQNLELDRWLNFEPPVAQRYESEHGRERVAMLRAAIYVGLVLYNAYNLTSFILLPDILWLSIVLRVLAVTPASLFIAWLIGRVSPRTRERLILAGVLNAYCVPVFLFWLTQAPLGAYTFAELSLSLTFGNMLLVLRFPHATAFTLGTLSIACLAVLTKSDIQPSLQFAFVVQITTACVFTLYANYKIERRRCRDYLISLAARLRSEAAEADRQEFHDLSRTDALTRLPNRRVLDEQLDEWFDRHAGIAVMMIDVDYFKRYNDTLGHPAGDDCLRSIAAVFRSATDRADALCVRFGGEEFTVALRDTSELEAARLAHQLVQAIEVLALAHPGRNDGLGIITVSIGVASGIGGGPASKTELLAAADNALYEAKRRGRNQVVFGGVGAQRHAVTHS